MVDIWTLSGIDTGRWHIRKGSSWRPPVTVRAQSLNVPGMHGVVPVGLPVFDVPQVSLRLRCGLGSQDSVESVTNELIGLLAAPGLTLGRESGGIVTSAVPRLLSVNDEEFLWNHSARFIALLDIPGVFFKAASTDTAPVVITSGQTYELPGLGVGTAPITDAMLRFLGPLTSVQVIDPVSGTGLSWTGSLTAGNFLYLYPSLMKARRSSSSTAFDPTVGTDVTSGLSRPGSGILQIWPRMAAADPAVRSARLTVTGAGFTSATTMKVRAQPAYL
jgi:hypothetical protein